MTKVNQKRIAAYILRAQQMGSTAATLRGAGKYILAHTESPFSRPARRPSPRMDSRAVRAARLVRRYAGLSIFPRYLSSGDRAAIKGSKAHQDVLTMRSKPDFARAYYLTPAIESIPRFEPEVRRANLVKGTLVESATVAHDAESRYDWGLLRVHTTGECVTPSRVGVRQTGSNSDWHKRSTLQRYADYSLISPAKHGPVCAMHYVSADHSELRVLRTAHFIQIEGCRPVKLTPKPAVPKLVRAAVRLLIAHGRDAYIERSDKPIRERVCIGRGEDQYHLSIDWTPKGFAASVLRAGETAITEIRKRHTERHLVTRNAELDALIAAHRDSMYVEVADSLAAGNCESVTMQFARQVWERLGAQGPAAVRADQILSVRNDSYTMRACRVAALRYL